MPRSSSHSKHGPNSVPPPPTGFKSMLSGLVGFNFVNLGVEIQDVNALWLLTFEDRARLGLKESQLPRADGAGAVNGNRDLTYALTYDSGQIETRPEMTAVRPHPAVVDRDSVGPETAQELTPVDCGLRCPFQCPIEPDRNFARLPRHCHGLIDSDIPLPRLFLNGWGLIVRERRIENLADSSLCLGGGRLIGIALRRRLIARTLCSGPSLSILVAGLALAPTLFQGGCISVLRSSPGSGYRAGRPRGG